jgi:hypothetical protein
LLILLALDQVCIDLLPQLDVMVFQIDRETVLLQC